MVRGDDIEVLAQSIEPRLVMADSLCTVEEQKRRALARPSHIDLAAANINDGVLCHGRPPSIHDFRCFARPMDNP